jgi:hypothetical protein
MPIKHTDAAYDTLRRRSACSANMLKVRALHHQQLAYASLLIRGANMQLESAEMVRIIAALLSPCETMTLAVCTIKTASTAYKHKHYSKK